jgi:hypothetical protein
MDANAEFQLLAAVALGASKNIRVISHLIAMRPVNIRCRIMAFVRTVRRATVVLMPFGNIKMALVVLMTGGLILAGARQRRRKISL